MTNKEKFIEIFGFEPDARMCIAPIKVCADIKKNNPELDYLCNKCPFFGWFNKEYKECFRLRGDL